MPHQDYVYNYDPRTRQYIGKSCVDLDPQGGPDDILLPASATLTPPPSEVPPGMAACWYGEWVVSAVYVEQNET